MAHEYPEEIKGLIYKEWLPRILAGVLEGVRELPQEHRDHVMMKMAKACAAMAVWAVGIRSDMSWDEYVKHMTELPPPQGPRTIEQVGDIVQVTYHCSIGEDGRPICQCPMVKLGMVEPFPELCACGANMGACFIEAVRKEPAAKSEMMGSPLTTGEPFCRYIVYLKPSLFTTPKHEL